MALLSVISESVPPWAEVGVYGLSHNSAVHPSWPLAQAFCCRELLYFLRRPAQSDRGGPHDVRRCHGLPGLGPPFHEVALQQIRVSDGDRGRLVLRKYTPLLESPRKCDVLRLDRVVWLGTILDRASYKQSRTPPYSS